jgi:hypothetical protein
VLGIPVSAFPVYVTVFECQKGVDQGQSTKVQTSEGPFLGEINNVLPCKSGNNVNNPACMRLTNDIQALRNGILNLCPAFTDLKNQRDAAGSVAAVAAGIAGALAAAASITPWPLNLVAWILASIALTVATAAAIAWFLLKGKVENLAAQLAHMRIRLSALVNRLNDICCPEFVGVMRDIPLCP